MTRQSNTRAERRELLERLLTDTPELSNREAARKAGSDHKTAAKVRGELERSGAIRVRTLRPQRHGGALIPPAEVGNGRATTHGAWSERRLLPRVDELTEELRHVVPGAMAADQTAIRLLALVLARIEAATAWLDERGLFKDARGTPWPVLRNLAAWENSARSLCDALGLTVTARARLGVVKPGEDGYAAFLAAVRSEENGHRE